MRNKKGEFLLQLRDEEPEINKWVLFGGGVESQETEEQALRREIKEELGYEIKDAEFFRKYENNNIEQAIFILKDAVELNNLNLSEGYAMKFFSASDLTNLNIGFNFKEILNDYSEEFKGINIDLIEKIEGKIKELCLNPKQKTHSFSDKDTKEFFGSFWFLHIKPVIDYSKELAKKYNGDLETLWLAAILHDISRLDDLEPHDEIGADMAHKLLLENGFSKEVAEKVKNTIITHSCKENKPQTLEQKLLATADAVIHFKAPFYLWWEHISKSDMKENFESGLKKIDRDYNDKIFFKEEKELIKKEYEVLKSWFKYRP